MDRYCMIFGLSVVFVALKKWRYILDAVSNFFIIVTPGLELLAESELRSKWQQLGELDASTWSEIPEIKVIDGGIELQTKNECAWHLNRYLKIPTRILQRVHQFKAKDFPPLFNGMKWVPWAEFFREGEFEVKVSTHKSRLRMKNRIEKVAQEAILDAKKHSGWRKKFLETPQGVFLRIVNDQVLVSVDTSGDLLYRRGYKPFTVDAPIRETLAAAMFWNAMKEIKWENQLTIWDPFCGSGTMLLESAAFNKSLRVRKFAFENFPQSPQHVSFDFTRDLKTPWETLSLHGWDVSAKAVKAAIENFSASSKWLPTQANIEEKNSFESEISEPTLLLTNPPYGERLPHAEIRKNFDKLILKNKPKWVSFCYPSEKEMKPPEGYREVSATKTFNGGIGIYLYLWSRH